jgi:molecular chaperone GrpE
MEMFLRARAELENFRKRAQADVAAAHKYAIESFAESLLPVKDSLEMALKVDTPTVENLQEGVNATLRLMANAFEKHKLHEIDPLGEKFDPNRHQAISMVPAADVPANHVVSVLQKGYLINDRVLRPALVTVRSGT